MAVVVVDAQEIQQMAGMKKEEIIDGLSDIGMPTEENGEQLMVEVTPNRPDLFSVEGLARALRLFYSKKTLEHGVESAEYTVKIDKSVGSLRPYFVCAVVRGVRMNDKVLTSMIQLQEKLHDTVGRKRRKVAIGLHNADSVAFPLVYRFVDNARFVPLDFDYEMDVTELLEKHPKGIAYSKLVGPKYPMLYDQKGVISFPPIINSERTRVTENTSDLVIDVTGTHLETVSTVLNILVYALAERGGKIFQVSVDGINYPNLSYRAVAGDRKEINKLLGLNLKGNEIAKHLALLGWKTNNGYFAPPYRLDVLSYVDIAEDVAIAVGYNNLEATMPDFFTSGGYNKVFDGLRESMCRMGFQEVVGYTLTNQTKHAVFPGAGSARIVNPKTEEFNVFRGSIMTTLTEVLAVNKTHKTPLRLFEVGYVFDDKERIKLAYVFADERADFAVGRGFLQKMAKEWGFEFTLKVGTRRQFARGRCADIYIGGRQVGFLGELSPEYLELMRINNPVVACEIDVSSVVKV